MGKGTDFTAKASGTHRQQAAKQKRVGCLFYFGFLHSGLTERFRPVVLTDRNNFRKGDGSMTYVFLANGFEEIEALTPVDLLRRVGVPVQTVGVGGRQITGAHQIPVTADLEESEISLDDLKMVVLPGGLPGTPNLEQSQIVKNAVTACYENGGYVAAICAAPSILGHMGLLQGKRATVSDGFISEITGAQYTGELVTQDGRIVTGRGPIAAMAFALHLADLLAPHEEVEKLRNLMQCR